MMILQPTGNTCRRHGILIAVLRAIIGLAVANSQTLIADLADALPGLRAGTVQLLTLAQGTANPDGSN